MRPGAAIKGFNGETAYWCSTESQGANLLHHGDELVGKVIREVCISACWAIQILQCPTGGELSCDTVIYHSPS